MKFFVSYLDIFFRIFQSYIFSYRLLRISSVGYWEWYPWSAKIVSNRRCQSPFHPSGIHPDICVHRSPSYCQVNRDWQVILLFVTKWTVFNLLFERNKDTVFHSERYWTKQFLSLQYTNFYRYFFCFFRHLFVAKVYIFVATKKSNRLPAPMNTVI